MLLLPFPTIAAINGHAPAGGAFLAQALKEPGIFKALKQTLYGDLAERFVSMKVFLLRAYRKPTFFYGK
ncbi:hypothetical protein BST96_00370 [Oceanicoccus sagamiensis]|uniref:Uncharacterized protein n=1 Tax=Oceanicoccus sagamiensis TaxID=716816 RepID=A0A1X9N8E0_9GAMM|nr:hypothetical protein BST96_00370 [Oceanicoccus sagamiensis]